MNVLLENAANKSVESNQSFSLLFFNELSITAYRNTAKDMKYNTITEAKALLGLRILVARSGMNTAIWKKNIIAKK